MQYKEIMIRFFWEKKAMYGTSGTITSPKVRPNKIMLMPYIHLRKIK